MASQSQQSPTSSSEAPKLIKAIYRDKIPRYRRILYFFQLTIFKIFVSTGLFLFRLLRPLPPLERATFSKRYSCRPHLKHRVFIPQSYKAGDALLPLYVSIHGGGFALGNPGMDDEFCGQFANRFNIVVVSINYSKAPRHCLPSQTHDIAAVALAVFEDRELPTDPERAVIGGFSAGGNLALSACQLPQMQGKFRAVVPWYPVTDFSIPMPEKLSKRAYGKKDDPDPLKKMGPLFDWGYVPRGVDLRDPLLSVGWAHRDLLPQWIYCIAAEYDSLAEEARDMVCRFAGVESMTEEEKYEFERGTLRWTLVKEAKHGFTIDQVEGNAANMTRKVLCDAFYPVVAEWLFKGPFAK